MYRLQFICSLALGCCLSSHVTAQQSNLESVIIENLPSAEPTDIQKPAAVDTQTKSSSSSEDAVAAAKRRIAQMRKAQLRQIERDRAINALNSSASPTDRSEESMPKSGTQVQPRIASMSGMIVEEYEDSGGSIIKAAAQDELRVTTQPPLPVEETTYFPVPIADDPGFIVESDQDAPAPQSVATAPTCDYGCQTQHYNCACQSTTSPRNLCERCKECWYNTCIYQRHVRNLGDPSLFCERPFGLCNEGFADAMILAGKADRAILHHYDFECKPDGNIILTGRGHRELHRIAEMMNQDPLLLSIEPTFDSQRDEARKQAVAAAITQLELPISLERVQTSRQPTIGLSGVDAQAIQLIRTSEIITGASRSRPFRDSAAAVIIPIIGASGAAGGLGGN